MKYFFSDSHLNLNDDESITLKQFLEFNSKLQNDDEIYCLGDFVDIKEEDFRSDEFCKKLYEFVDCLKGNWFLIPGNHDKPLRLFDGIKNLKILDSIYEVKLKNKISLICCHFPIEEWDKKHKGTFHLHGHLHGHLPCGIGGRKNISSNIKFNEVINFYNELEIVDIIVKEVMENTILINEEYFFKMYINAFIVYDLDNKIYQIHRYAGHGNIDEFLAKYGTKTPNIIFIDYFGNWFRLNKKITSRND